MFPRRTREIRRQLQKMALKTPKWYLIPEPVLLRTLARIKRAIQTLSPIQMQKMKIQKHKMTRKTIRKIPRRNRSASEVGVEVVAGGVGVGVARAAFAAADIGGVDRGVESGIGGAVVARVPTRVHVLARVLRRTGNASASTRSDASYERRGRRVPGVVRESAVMTDRCVAATTDRRARRRLRNRLVAMDTPSPDCEVLQHATHSTYVRIAAHRSDADPRHINKAPNTAVARPLWLRIPRNKDSLLALLLQLHRLLAQAPCVHNRLSPLPQPQPLLRAQPLVCRTRRTKSVESATR